VDLVIAVVPPGVYDHIVELSAETAETTRRKLEVGETIAEGLRRETIFHVALGLAHEGLGEAEIMPAALAVNGRCDPPLDERQVRTQVRGAVKRVRVKPRDPELVKAARRAEELLGSFLSEEARGRDEPEQPTSDDHAAPPPRAEHEEQPRGSSSRRLAWEEPVPLAGRPPVPPFPIEKLPGWLRSWAVETAAEKGANVDLAGTLALGVVAGALARHVQVSPRPGWWEPINLYLAVALEPGQRKTPVFKAAFRPVRTLERKRIGEWEEQNRLVSISGAILDKRRKELIDEAAGDEELDPEQLRERMDEMLEGLGEIETTARPRLLTEDVTPEGLAQLLAEHGRIIAASDEGAAIFENFSGRYTRGSPSWDVYNKAHSAADLVVDRKSSGPVIVWDPALTLVIATQPKTLSDLTGKPGAIGRGVLARPLYALPGPAYLSGRTPPVAEAALAEFDTRVRNLFEDVPLLAVDEEERPQPVTLRLDPAAEIMFERFEEELALERRALGTSDEAEDQAAYLGWISKLAGQTARLAACLHAAEQWSSGSTSNTTIESGSVTAAIELARYFREHALVVFGLMGELPEQRRAQTILGWLRERSSEELELLTVRDVHRSRGKGTTAAQVKTAIGLLEQHGYVRVERARVGGAKRGPMPERLHVHPGFREAEKSSETPDKPDEFQGQAREPVGFVGSVGSDSGSSDPVQHRDPTCRERRRWKAVDGVWRCASCEPYHFPGEVLEERDG
jgi:replicative DNA helicase